MTVPWHFVLTAMILLIIGALAVILCVHVLPAENAQLIGNIVTGLFSALTGGAVGYAAAGKSPSPQSKDPPL